MGISKFKQDSALANSGKWFEFSPNPDKTIPRVRLGREGRANKRWLTIFREVTKDVDTDDLTAEEDFATGVEVFAKACVLEWENIQPNEDGVTLANETSEYIKLLSDPDWADFYSDLKDKASTRDNFKKREEEAKN